MSNDTNNPKTSRRKRKPPTTPEERENYMISLAMEQAERMLVEGRAPAPVLVHYLKLATTREEIEKEKLRRETELLRAKSEVMESQRNAEEMYEQAIAAMRSYSPGGE